MSMLPAERPVPMLRKAMHALAAVAAVAICGHATAQLTVNPQTDLQQLARTITGPGVSISNPQINCHGQGFGQFQYAGSVLGIDEGILLTTGTINNALGPNNVENKTFVQNFPGSAILNQVSGKTTYDACMFQFDVIPGGDNLRFDFVFGSEEYNEYVGSQYNDVFGFFISGPGITGDPGIGSDKNIALVPGTNQAVTINNVNNGSNASRYFDNAGGQYLQYDGITRGLSAQATVQPCQSYHLKLIVADASDKKYDSGVFIAKVKSNPVTMQLITANGADSLIEGCNNGVVRFTRQSVTNQPLALQYFLQGTATNGADYEAIGDPSPSAPKTITIPANHAYVDQPITTIADGTPEGLETILFILGNPFCPDTGSDTLVVKLADEMHAAAAPASSMICSGGQVQLTASGGTQYSWAPSLGLSSATSSSPLAHPVTTTQYTVTVSRGDCSTQQQVEVKVSAMQATAAITRPLCSGASNGALGLAVSGGIPPYTYQWSGPNGLSATTKDLSFIPAGTYSVTITDAACSKTFSFQVGQPAPLSVSLTPSLLVFGQNISCAGGHDGSIASTTTGGTGPYTVAWTGPGGFTSILPDIGNLGEGTYTVTVTDAKGCTATTGTTLLASAPMAAAITGSSNVACANDGSGSASVAVSGGMPTYSYAWNTTPVQTTATATGLAPGTYQVTATDQYGCRAVQSVSITGPLMALATQLASLTPVSCAGAGGGQATISVSGGTPAYTVAWNTVPAQAGYTATGLAGGTYTATVTDANGCQTARQVAIAEPASPLTLAATAQQHIACAGQSTGSATVAAAGGTAPYAYTWNTAPAHNGASITGLAAGTYTVTATDAKGCSAELQRGDHRTFGRAYRIHQRQHERALRRRQHRQCHRIGLRRHRAVHLSVEHHATARHCHGQRPGRRQLASKCMGRPPMPGLGNGGNIPAFTLVGHRSSNPGTMPWRTERRRGSLHIRRCPTLPLGLERPQRICRIHRRHQRPGRRRLLRHHHRCKRMHGHTQLQCEPARSLPGGRNPQHVRQQQRELPGEHGRVHQSFGERSGSSLCVCLVRPRRLHLRTKGPLGTLGRHLSSHHHRCERMQHEPGRLPAGPGTPCSPIDGSRPWRLRRFMQWRG